MRWEVVAAKSGAGTCSTGPGAVTGGGGGRKAVYRCHLQLQRKLKLVAGPGPQPAGSLHYYLGTACPHCAPGSLLRCCRASPQGPRFLGAASTSLKPIIASQVAAGISCPMRANYTSSAPPRPPPRHLHHHFSGPRRHQVSLPPLWSPVSYMWQHQLCKSPVWVT